jgi:hypothetical protein
LSAYGNTREAKTEVDIHNVYLGYYIPLPLVSIFVFTNIIMSKATKIKREKLGVIIEEAIAEAKAEAIEIIESPAIEEQVSEAIEIIESPAIVPHVTAVTRQEASAPSNRVKVLNAHTGRIIAMAVVKSQAEKLVKNNPNLKIEY